MSTPPKASILNEKHVRWSVLESSGMRLSWAQFGHNSTRRLPDHLVRRCEWGHTSRSWLFLLMACLSASPSCDRRRIKSTFTAQVPGHTRLFSGSQRQLGSTRSEHRPTHYRPLGAAGTSRLVV